MILNHPTNDIPINKGYGYASVLPFLLNCSKNMSLTDKGATYSVPEYKWGKVIKILENMIELVYEFTFKRNVDKTDEIEFLNSMQAYTNDLYDEIITQPYGRYAYAFNVICNLEMGLRRVCERLIEEMGFIGYDRELLMNNLNRLVYLNGRDYTYKYLKHYDNKILEKITKILKKIKWDKADVLMLFDFLRENYDIDLVKNIDNGVILDIFHEDSPYAISHGSEDQLADLIAQFPNFRESLRIWLTNNL